MTDEQTKRMNELADEAYGDPIGSMRHEAFSKGYTAGHQDASADADDLNDVLHKIREVINCQGESTLHSVVRLVEELTALKESAKGLVEALENADYFIKDDRKSGIVIPDNFRSRAEIQIMKALAAYNTKIGG